MAYNTQNYWVFGLCPSSSILKKNQTENTFWKLDLFPSSGEGRETPTLLRPLEKANLNHNDSEQAFF
jgi:hypothetical protein